MKKVLLQTINYPGIGGIERSFEVLKYYLKTSGYETTIISQKKSYGQQDTQEEVYFEKKFTWLMFEPLITYYSYKNFIQKNVSLFEENILIVRYLPLSYALIQINFKHIFIPPNVSLDFFDGIIDNLMTTEKKIIIKILKILKWKMIKRINIFFEKKVMDSNLVNIITFSENVKQNLLQNNNFKRQITVMNPGIDKRYFFRLQENEICKYKIELGIQNDDFVVLYVGRISLGKNIHILKKAFELLSVENKKLLLVGEGEVDVYDDSNIIKVGKKSIEQLHIYYSISNVLVLPTFNEGFGQVLIESLGCGTPVVGFDTRHNAIDEIITDELFGQKTKELTDDGLADTLYQMYNKKMFYSDNRKNIEISIKNKFSWDLFIERILK